MAPRPPRLSLKLNSSLKPLLDLWLGPLCFSVVQQGLADTLMAVCTNAPTSCLSQKLYPQLYRLASMRKNIWSGSVYTTSPPGIVSQS
ncbi:hypothetical protein E2C01_031029 [Portunus trituberculatus]|uniref:Uncharacterized protein n=1 Tax=Portunus trituberculatus TaxID=210409 RepID=A0A5B7EXG7_PORTR|nr:hypothetical protein [Portunus trituberculatus]